jgi:hypothetical protein
VSVPAVTGWSTSRAALLQRLAALLPGRGDYAELRGGWGTDMLAGVTVAVVALPRQAGHAHPVAGRRGLHLGHRGGHRRSAGADGPRCGKAGGRQCRVGGRARDRSVRRTPSCGSPRTARDGRRTHRRPAEVAPVAARELDRRRCHDSGGFGHRRGRHCHRRPAAHAAGADAARPLLDDAVAVARARGGRARRAREPAVRSRGRRHGRCGTAQSEPRAGGAGHRQHRVGAVRRHARHGCDCPDRGQRPGRSPHPAGSAQAMRWSWPC